MAIATADNTGICISGSKLGMCFKKHDTLETQCVHVLHNVLMWVCVNKGGGIHVTGFSSEPLYIRQWRNHRKARDHQSEVYVLHDHYTEQNLNCKFIL